MTETINLSVPPCLIYIHAHLNNFFGETSCGEETETGDDPRGRDPAETKQTSGQYTNLLLRRLRFCGDSVQFSTPEYA